MREFKFPASVKRSSYVLNKQIVYTVIFQWKTTITLSICRHYISFSQLYDVHVQKITKAIFTFWTSNNLQTVYLLVHRCPQKKIEKKTRKFLVSVMIIKFDIILNASLEIQIMFSSCRLLIRKIFRFECVNAICVFWVCMAWDECV